MSFRVLGTGMYVPPRVVTNDDLSQFLETNDEWITQRVGVKERHISTNETAADMGAKAARAALENSGVAAEEIDLILAASVSGESISPSVSCMIQNLLGLSCMTMDINAACSAFDFLLETAAGFFARGKVKKVLAEQGLLHRAYVAVKVGMEGQRTCRMDEADPADIPYFSVAVVPTAHDVRSDLGGEDVEKSKGSVTVVGLGPGAARWTTPEVSRALREATDIVGYTTYVKRVPERPGQVRHLSDNRVEAERSEHALQLAREGKRVVVVSSGDPGVFAMASAVLEVQHTRGYEDVPVHVLPGMTAAQAVASRVGAPLGHDFALISLSNRLKPWDQVTRRVRAVAGVDMAMAIYNPASKKRTWQVQEFKDIVLEYREPETPVIVARAVGSPEEHVTITTLGELDPSVVDMRTMLVVGTSTSVAYSTDDGPRVYTSRYYGTPEWGEKPSQ